MHSRHRLIVTLLSVPVLFLFLLYLISRPTITDLFSVAGPGPKLPDEIFGLLHFVTSPDEAGRVVAVLGNPAHDSTSDVPQSEVQLGGPITPGKPVGMAWYAFGSITKNAGPARGRGLGGSVADWEERMRVLREEYPLVVFSKSYCPYSRRAKKLLETYDVSPAPKIIEVDLRADSAHIKVLLTRLTHQSTFPNVILHGRSLGGSDDLVQLHEKDELRRVLEQGGLKVGWAGEPIMV